MAEGVAVPDKIIRVSLRRIRELAGAEPLASDKLINMALADVERLVREYRGGGNPCHEPAGSPDGGQFCPGDGGGESGDSSELSKREKEAIENYQNEGFHKINSDLRHGKGLNADGRAIEAAIAKSSLKEAITVYRGVGHTLTNQIVALWEENGTATFIDKAFVSTSGSKAIAETFSKHTIEIKLPKGFSALNIEDFENKHEREVLLARGTKFKVIGVKKTPSGYRRFRVEIVP
jgi:ADP-ribosyltransferase exoenzyme